MTELTLAEIAAKGAGYGVWTLVLIALVTLIKGWPALRKLSIEADGSLRRDLMERIARLEEENRELRAKYDGLMRQFIQAQMAWAQAIPPDRRSPAVNNMIETLNDMDCGESGQ